MKKSLGASERIRQVLGVLVLVGVAAIALGLDTRVLSKLSSAQTASLEIGPRAQARREPGDERNQRARTGKMGELILPVEGTLPPLDGLGPWFNSPPLTREQLQGQGRGDRFLDLQLHQLPALAALHQGVGRESTARTAWSSSAFTRPSSRSSAIRPTSPRRSRTSASPTRSRSIIATSCGTRSRTITGRRITSSMRRDASATTISARANMRCRSG